MNAYEAYVTYCALKLHFSSPSYDFVKYGGKIKADPRTFETRKDKYFFQKLAKQANVFEFLLANFIDGKPNAWIGDLVNDGKGYAVYHKWLKRKQSLSYNFKEELSKLGDDFLPNLKVEDGQHPRLLKLYASGQISIETLIIIDDFTSCLSLWDGKITDPVYWPTVKMKAMKYKPFVEYDREKMKLALLEAFGKA